MSEPGVNKLNLQALGNVLREARLAASLSLQQAAGTRLTAPGLYRIERGEVCPTAGNLLHLVDTTGADLMQVLPLWAQCERRLSQLYQMSNLLREAGRYTAAMLLLPYLSDRKPGRNRWLPWAAMERGRLALERGAYQDALDGFERAMTLAEQLSDWSCRTEALAFTGLALRYLWRPIQAVRYLELAARHLRPRAPLYTRVLVNLAHAQLDAGVYHEAARMYDTLLSDVRDPRLSVEIREAKALSLERLGDPESALKLQRSLLKLVEADRDPRAIARILHNMGLSYKRTGTWAEADSLWKASLEIQLNGFDAICTLDELAQNALATGQVEQALVYLDKAEAYLASYPHHPARATLVLLREGASGDGVSGGFSRWSSFIGAANPELQPFWLRGSLEAALHLGWSKPAHEAFAALNGLTLQMLIQRQDAR